MAEAARKIGGFRRQPVIRWTGNRTEEETKMRLCSSLAEYEALPEGVRCEVYEGRIVDMASPNELHQTISQELGRRIGNHIYDRKGKCRVFSAPFDVVLQQSPMIIVQPDILVVCDRDKLDGKRCNGAPDLCIEIVSPGNPDNDYKVKAGYYQRFGVREYWIIDPQKRKVTVYDFDQVLFPDTPEPATSLELPVWSYDFSDRVPVGIFDDLEIDFADLIAYAES